MPKRKKEQVEYRYYEMPANSHILALQGEKWIQVYGCEPLQLHIHNYMEIGYCYFGKGKLWLEDKACDYSKGSFSIIPAGVMHTTISEGKANYWEYLFLDVKGCLDDLYPEETSYKSSLLSRICHKPWLLDEKTAPQAATLVKMILEEMREKKDYYREKVTGIVLQILMDTARMSQPQMKTEGFVTQKDQLLFPAIEYIQKNYARPIRVKELSDMCFISENHFRKIFQERVHMTPTEFINFTRIHTACTILKKTEKPIMEVAREVGFPTLSTFNRNFKRYVGDVTPYDWRKSPENYEQKLLKYRIRPEEGW